MSATGSSRPGSKAERLQRAAYEVLLEHERDGALPTSNRFLFYELFQRGVLSKSKTRATGRRPDQDLSDASFRLRDARVVPWSWIVDETGELHDWAHAATIADYLARGSRSRPHRRVGWTPAASAPLRVTHVRGRPPSHPRAGYLRPVAATNGQVGGFLRTDVSPLLREGDRPVLYIGDLDLSGGQIEENTRRVLVRETSRDLDWRRVALTAGHVAEHGLDALAIVKRDRRYRDGRPHEAIEVEALGQTTVVRLVRAALDALLPQPLEDVLARERWEREQVAALLRSALGGEA
jgi:hypothetical protein